MTCMFAEHGHLKDLTTAFFGNYTVQDLLGAAHKLRQAAAKLRARNTASNSDIERMLGFSDGQDSLGTISITPYHTNQLQYGKSTYKFAILSIGT